MAARAGVGEWAKELNATAYAVATAIITVLQNGEPFGARTVLGVALAGLVAFGGVAAVRNAAGGVWYYAKAILTLITVAVGAVVAQLVDAAGWDLSGLDWRQVALALVSAVLVFISPNAVESTYSARRALVE